MLEAGEEKGSERREVMRKRRRRRFFLPGVESSPSMSVRGRGRLRGVIGSWVADEDEDEGRKGKVKGGLGGAGRKVKRAVFGIVGAAVVVVVVDAVVVVGGFEAEAGIELEVEEEVGDRRSGGEDMLMDGGIRDARRSKDRPIFFAVCRDGRRALKA